MITYEELARAAADNDAVSEEVGLADLLRRFEGGDQMLKFAERRAVTTVMRLHRRIPASQLPRDIQQVDLTLEEQNAYARIAACILDGLCVMARVRENGNG